ncbi:hypothetical protein MCHI_003435 [Candidatus Magnetoovum chiemensis]|nr:hypothetical protein MCHI_003435 [Candidatus Magnetoovum chiemensis]
MIKNLLNRLNLIQTITRDTVMAIGSCLTVLYLTSRVNMTSSTAMKPCISTEMAITVMTG